MDPRRPLLAFLAAALPENHPQLLSLAVNLEEHVDKIGMTPQSHFIGDHASLSMSLSNVPGTVGEVKTRVVWVQVPTEHGLKLELVHRVCHRSPYLWCYCLIRLTYSSKWKWSTTGMRPL